MALQFRTVIVKQLPETKNEEQEWAFLESLKSSLQADRPRIVLNCSSIEAFNESTLHLLLCCLEECMKRNGDVRLSALSKSARASLALSGIDRLFKIFESDAEAVKSFQRLPVFTSSEPSKVEMPVQSAGYAAEMPLEAGENAA